jgi:hypothetical protein
MFKKIIAWWKIFVVKMNEKGIPVPTIRDPKTKEGSVSFTMVCVSFGLMSLAVLMCLALVVNKWAGFFDADASALADLKEAFWMSFEMGTLSCSLYFGRKLQFDNTTKKVDLSDKVE